MAVINPRLLSANKSENKNKIAQNVITKKRGTAKKVDGSTK